MTTANNDFMPVYELVGQVMTDLGAHYEILILRFGEYEIHVSCFARILHNGKILLTTQDYQSWDEKDHKQNDMYLNIAKYGETLIGQKVRSVEVSPINDLFIVLDNDTRIEIYNSEASHQLSEESEQWFFYKPKDKEYPYLSVTNHGIEIESKE
jgi:tRNA nucleotidyltransferase (CCA-adding enzyme)